MLIREDEHSDHRPASLLPVAQAPFEPPIIRLIFRPRRLPARPANHPQLVLVGRMLLLAVSILAVPVLGRTGYRG